MIRSEDNDGKSTRLGLLTDNLWKRHASFTADERSDGFNSQKGKTLYVFHFMSIITVHEGSERGRKEGAFKNQIKHSQMVIYAK